MFAQDQILARGLAQGKESAYRKLFQEHFPPLYEMALHLVKDEFAAKTIVGDFFFHIWEIRGRLNIGTSLRGYLSRGVYNSCLNYLNSRNALRGESLTGEVSRVADSITPLEQVLGKELEKEISEVIRSLPEQTRKVFLLHRRDSLTYEDIASGTGLSVNTVKYHIKKALKVLKKSIGNYIETLP